MDAQVRELLVLYQEPLVLTAMSKGEAEGWEQAPLVCFHKGGGGESPRTSCQVCEVSAHMGTMSQPARKTCKMEKRCSSESGKMETMPDPDLSHSEERSRGSSSPACLLSSQGLLSVCSACLGRPAIRDPPPPPDSAVPLVCVPSHHTESFLDSHPTRSELCFPNDRPLQCI